MYGVFACGEGLAFDKRGRELMAASWRPWRNLQFLDYSTGCVTSEVEPELEPHYNTAAVYFPQAANAKDYVVTAATDKGIVKARLTI